MTPRVAVSIAGTDSGGAAGLAADLTTGGDRPVLRAQLEAEALDLSALTTGDNAQATTAPTAAPGWSTAPIDASALGLIDGEIGLTAPEIDLGVTKESDSDSTSIDGTLVAELTPDAAPVETIRITQVDVRSTKKNINLSYSFGPFGLLGKAKFTMKNLQILLVPAEAGEAAELDDEGNFTQEGNIPTLTGLVVYDVNIVGVKKKDEIDLGNPEDIPEGNEQKPFTIEGNLTWNGDVPVLRFDFAIE